MGWYCSTPVLVHELNIYDVSDSSTFRWQLPVQLTLIGLHVGALVPELNSSSVNESDASQVSSCLYSLLRSD
jgi:hypothetical protein